jgi:hypothetical protein
MLETDGVRNTELAVEESRDQLDLPPRSSPAHSRPIRIARAQLPLEGAGAPADNRDMTVPTGTPRIPATSRYENPPM